MNKFGEKLDKFYGITEKKSSFTVEILAGITTFLAMAYILTVNPNQILYAGAGDPRWASVFIATAFGAIIGTLLMSLLAKMPYAQAPGMGLNAVVGSVIGGGVGAFGYSFEFSLPNALMMVLISGIVFLIVSIVPVGRNKQTGALVTLREKIFDGIPAGIRAAIPVGIGFFISFIGLQNAKLVSLNQYTLVQFVDFTKWELGNAACSAIVCLISFFAIAILHHAKVKGSVIIGVLIGTIVAIPLKVSNVAEMTVIDILCGKAGGVSWKFWENFATFFSFDPDKGGLFFAAFTEGFNLPAGSIFTAIMLIITFCMIDMFDTMGTIVGCATKAGLVDENGKPLNYNKCMYADSVATVAGAMLGTSTVTTFVESGTGIAEGGKTGLTALTTAVLFLLSIFILPVFAAIPSAAAGAALIYVGVLMMSTVKNIDFTDIRIAVPAFLAIIMMPLTYSITKGIGISILSYVVISMICYVVDIIKYSVQSKKAPAAETAGGGDVAAVEETESSSVSDEAQEEKSVEKPKWPVSIVTGVIAALFIVYFFVPTVF